MHSPGRIRIWVVSELYYPEETSTGRFVTGIAEALASRHDVRVLCSQPTYLKRGTLAPAREDRGGVSIERVWSTRLDKNSLAGKVLNMLTFSGSILLRLIWSLRRGDLIFVVTNPPTLPYLCAAAAPISGARTVLLIHDVYPQVLTATGMIKPDSLVDRGVRALSRWLYRRMERIVVIGRDMAAIILETAPDVADRLALIPNWGDTVNVTPTARSNARLLERLNLRERFVVQYFGNMGRTHGMESLVEAARQLAVTAPDIHFLFIGEGARKASLESLVRQHTLANCTILPTCAESELSDYLNSCDVAIVTLLPGMAGVSVPSRIYNILAAGKPIIAAVEDSSEVARVVREEEVGWVVPPEDVGAIVNAILEARTAPQDSREMSARARGAAVANYSADSVHEQYLRLFDELVATNA